MSIPNRRLLYIVLSVFALLCVPFIAMRFTHEILWSPMDFIAAGVLLLGTGLLCELVLRRFPKTRHRVMICSALLLVLFLVWAELAVGIFGTPLAGS